MMIYLRELRDWYRDEWKKERYFTLGLLVVCTPILVLAFFLSYLFDTDIE